jgi:hypothetical protein
MSIKIITRQTRHFSSEKVNVTDPVFVGIDNHKNHPVFLKWLVHNC